ncbi:MAG: hypothetical protein ACI9BW_002996 [Gammaproteobacteria bacterium]|jgi:hypothetical protein
MKIPLPPGYLSAAPFDREHHRKLGVRDGPATFASGLNVIYLSAAEFPLACHYFPIVFAREQAENLVPVALTALDPGSNLFIDALGNWDPQTYCPAYVRRYPFFSATVLNEGKEQSLICVDERGLSSSAPPLINAQGNPTDRFREQELLISEMIKQQQDTERFCRSLFEHDLLEPLEADFHPRGMAEIRVAGLFRVTEQRLRNVHSDSLQALLKQGDLAKIYAHLLSFENFNRLLNRHVKYAK